jgi:Transposase, Mutator family
MTATPSIDLPAWMVEQLSQASPDLLRQMVQTFAEALMSADADAVCGAGYGQRSPDRSNTRPWSAWWPPAICSGCPRGGWTASGHRSNGSR